MGLIMRRYVAFVTGLLISLFALSFNVAAATSQPLALNHAYLKGNGDYDVVVKDAPGIKLALYINDKNPVDATTNKADWATFRNVKLVNNAKISFARVFGGQPPVQKPINYVRYAIIKNGNITFAKSRASAPVTPAATTTTTSTPALAPTAVTPPPAPATPPTSPSCTPLTNGGNCYEPGEYCRNTDHGVSGVAGDGETITCADNNGWRWEPS